MRLPCEVAVRSLVPAMRASIAKVLADEYGLKQDRIAELLNVTQAAVSYYTRQMRGAAVDVEGVSEVRQAVKEIAAALASGHWSVSEQMRRFCAACWAAREGGLICQLHKQMAPAMPLRDCRVCMPKKARGGRRPR